MVHTVTSTCSKLSALQGLRLDGGSVPARRTGGGLFCRARKQTPHALSFSSGAWAAYSGGGPEWDDDLALDTLEPEGVPDDLGRPQFRGQESMLSTEGEHGRAVAGRIVVLVLRVGETDTTLALMFLGGMGGGHLRLPAAFSLRSVLPEYQSTNPVSSSPDTPPDSVRQPHGGFSGVGAETPTWAETDSFLDQQHLGNRLWSVSGLGRSVPGPLCHGADRKTSKNRRVGGRMPAWRTYR